jgi:5-methylcytosine-specific restriction endonuclease McrA
VTRVPIDTEWFLKIGTRDRWTCHWCGTGQGTGDPWEVDHYIPLSRGGTNHVSNLRLAHRSCNRAKGSQVPDA